ncbi:hypothetical protein QKU48_gp0528 [Fadolivirus algeromassiliense]|jgi:ribosomal protein L24E|uniref:Uncharacterized protein n=1 Tax=Fadolivirus FV1/VV64 TaxID=3070911 RepID=A0A7D3QVS5_9VIRU|nr:hypothetical protein QKU48_gp0528 [Fadolivirus algeromassiliense]QKF93986.1 hypothetical protein Fadolivirus_1_528 [Fadolivirus FV1/VV64]
MSYECCKGCWTRPCYYCGRQLCPTSGHAEMYEYNDNECCWNCCNSKCSEDNNSKLKKLPHTIFDRIKKDLDDAGLSDKNLLNIIKRSIEYESKQSINDYYDSKSNY